jgi:nucleoside-diphosphate-sugar epimerase
MGISILVTGATGYIGTAMIPILLAEGFDVTGLDSDLFASCEFERPAEHAGVRHIRKDLRDVSPRDLEGFDAIFHLAALSNDPLGNLNPDVTYDINHRGSVHLAVVAKQAGVPRFVFSSSCSIYGAAGADAVTELAEFNPVTPYGTSKMLVERDVRPLADTSFSPVFLRNATAYGYSPRMRFDLVLNNLVAHAVASGRILIKSDGTPWRPVVHIEDICRAFIAAARAPREAVHNEAFNIGRNEENFQVRELADIVKAVVPGCTVEYAPGGEPDKRSYRVDFTKAHTALPGFNPQWTAQRGAQQLYDAYTRIGISVDDFEGPRFRRIDTLKQHLSAGRVDASLRWSAQHP